MLVMYYIPDESYKINVYVCIEIGFCLNKGVTSFETPDSSTGVNMARFVNNGPNQATQTCTNLKQHVERRQHVALSLEGDNVDLIW